jgi:hypothetical protein
MWTRGCLRGIAARFNKRTKVYGFSERAPRGLPRFFTQISPAETWASDYQSLRLFTRTKRPNAGFSSMDRRLGKLAPDPWFAKVLFGVLLTALVISEAALYSGLATIPETWPLN